MGSSNATLQEDYARYFFSVFDACLHQDEAGRRIATRHLEECLSRHAMSDKSVVDPARERV